MNYPNGIKKTYKCNSNHSNRGMTLENEINISNQYYLEINQAVIHKKPTSITIKNVDYRNGYDAVIKEAYFKTPSTTDYNGIYRGIYIDFEAKETSKDIFPLANIHPHQIKHLQAISEHGGVAFIILRFTKQNETYLLTFEAFNYFLENFERKSIPYSYVKEKGYAIKNSINPPVDYLKIIDGLYFKGDNYEKNN